MLHDPKGETPLWYPGTKTKLDPVPDRQCAAVMRKESAAYGSAHTPAQIMAVVSVFMTCEVPASLSRQGHTFGARCRRRRDGRTPRRCEGSVRPRPPLFAGQIAYLKNSSNSS